MARLFFYLMAFLLVLNESNGQFNIILNRYSFNRTSAEQTTRTLYNKKQQQPGVAKFINQSISIKTSNYYKCPSECSCQGLSIDCSNRRLTKVPLNIPYNVIKVYVYLAEY